MAGGFDSPTSMSPRLRSISSSSVIVAEFPGLADSGSSSNATMDCTFVFTREGMAITLAPGFRLPETTWP